MRYFLLAIVLSAAAFGHAGSGFGSTGGSSGGHSAPEPTAIAALVVGVFGLVRRRQMA